MEEGIKISEYQLSAQLRARDVGFTPTIRRAQKETEKLERGIGDVKKNQELKVKLGVEGMERLQRLQSAIQNARNNSNKPLSVRLRDQATQQLSKIRSEINSLTSKAHQVIVNVKTNGAEKLNGIKNSISEGVSGTAMGMGATMLGTAGIGYGVVNAVQSQMNFEKQMSSVKAILSGSYSGENLEKVMTELTAEAEKMGATTKFTATESAQALYYMGMAGWKSEQMVKGLPAILQLAAAGNTDLATASDIVTDSMTAFGLKAGETVNFNGKMVDSAKIYTDMMAALVTNANTDIPMLGETLKYAAPLIQAMYAKGSAEQKMAGAEDLMLVSGLMANAGVKASQAGTSARSMFTRLTSQNRNAYFAQNALGIDFADKQTGEARRLKDIVKDFRKVFNEGVEMEKVLDFFEQAAGEKIHADTRRKLNSYLENVQKNGGKMSGTEMMKMVAMLSGQEAMSGWLATFLASDDDFEKISNALDNAEGAAERMSKIQLDNLAGSVTLLGSAWDAFQRSFVKGDAGAGLRSFVDSVTYSLSKANKLFADGIDFSDIFALAADGITKLKNKFLELDGIGSLLAGGALFMGLKKILSMGLKVKDAISDLTKIRTAADLGNAIKGKQGAAGGLQSTATMNVTATTMNVRAGVVNLSGAVKGGQAPAGVGGGKNTPVLTNQQKVDDYYKRRQQITNQQRVDDYYKRRQQILTSGTIVPPVGAGGAATGASTGVLGTLKNGLKAGGGMLGISAVLGALDVYSTRANSEYENARAADELKAAQAHLKELQENGADINQIKSQLSAIREAEMNVQTVAETNRVNERRTNSGVAGMLAGTMAGAAIGSVFPLVGTAIGALIGGIGGQFGGMWLADYLSENKNLPLPQATKQLGGGISKSGADVATVTGLAATVKEIQSQAQEYRSTPEGMEATRRESEVQRQKLMEATWLKDYSDEEIRIRAETTRSNTERQVQAREQITKENERAITNFGGTLLGQNYLGNAPQSPIASYAEAAKNFNRWSSKVRAQSRGLTAPAITATTDSSKFTSAPTTYQNLNQSSIEGYKSRTDFRQPITDSSKFTTTQTSYQNLDKSAVNLSKTFDNLKTQFSGVGKTTQEMNFAQPIAGIQAAQPSQMPTVNLNKEAFNLSAAIGSLRERFSGAGATAQEKNYNYTQPMANVPNYSANMPPMGLPSIEIPEINVTEKIRAEIETLSTTVSSAWESLKTSTSSAFETVSTSINTGLETAKTTLSTFGEEISTSFSSGFESLKTSASTSFEEIATSMSTGLETIRTSLSTIGEEISTSFVTSFETLRTSASTIFEEISMSMSMGLETLKSSVITTGAEISTSFSASFETISVMASTTFSSLGATISGGVEAARAAITTAFQSAATEVQGVWGAIPGFFSGIFGGLGGIAAAAGSTIAAGINSGIGMIQSAWDALSGWLSAKIASLSSMAAGAAAAIGIGGNAKGTAYWRGGLTEVNEHGGELIILPSGKEIYPYATTQNVLQETKIAHNAKGTSFFSGGWSEVNEHGGELMYLPTGTKIIPHATTVRILREQIKERLNDKSSAVREMYSENDGTSRAFTEIGGRTSTTLENYANTSTTQGFFGNNRTLNNRSARNNLYGGEFKNFTEISGASIGGSSNSIVSEVGGRFSQIETSARNQERTDFSSVNDTRNIALPLAKRREISPDIHFGTLARYNSAESNIGRGKLKNGNSNTANQQSTMPQNPLTSNAGYKQQANTAGIGEAKSYSTLYSRNFGGFNVYSGNAVQTQALGGIDNDTAIFKQQQRQDSAKSTLEVNAESNNLRRYENRRSITTNRRFENATAFNDIQSGLSIAHNYTGTSYFKGGLTTVNEHGGEIISLPDGRNILPQFTFQNILKDSLGNIQGIKIPEYNRITADDSLEVKQAKQTAQYKQLFFSNNLRNLSAKSHGVSNFYNSVIGGQNVSQNLQQSTATSAIGGNVFNTSKPAENNIQAGIFSAKRQKPQMSLKNLPFPTHTIFAPVNGSTRGSIFNDAPTNITTQKQSSINSLGGIINIFRQSRRIFKPINAGDYWEWSKNLSGSTGINSINNFADNQFGNLNLLKSAEIGNLPVPEISAPKTPPTSANTSITNTTTNNNSSSPTINLGSVTINNGMELDALLHRFNLMLGQSASNSVQI